MREIDKTHQQIAERLKCDWSQADLALDSPGFVDVTVFNLSKEKFLALDSKDFVKQIYLTILGRPITEADLRKRCRQLETGTSRQELINSLLNSGEFKQKGCEAVWQDES